MSPRRRPMPGDSQTPKRLVAGTLVDHFRVMRMIGLGGMGQVYLARDTQLGRRVALKIIDERWLKTPGARDAFQREARTTAQFSHPNIVMLYEAGEYDRRPYLALEYIEGQALGARFSERRPGLRESLRIALAVSEALTEAHKHGVLHLDLKPDNIVIDRNGRVRVVDFGVASTIQAELEAERSGSEPGIGKGWGTPYYMAPEQWHYARSRPATDIWALGVIVFELVAGRLPFENADLDALGETICSRAPAPSLEGVPSVPDDLVDLIERCLRKAPAERPTAREVTGVLAKLVTGVRTTPASEVSPFRGLMAFGREHADLFFGREDEVTAFVERLRHHPIIPVVGPTGAGKSSFIEAGVIPRLREQGNWTILQIRPGARPFHALADRLRRRETRPRVLSDELFTRPITGVAAKSPPPSTGPAKPVVSVAEADVSADDLLEDRFRLSSALRRIGDEHDTRVLLVVDQLEELFTVAEDFQVRRAFLRALFTAADDPLDPIRVVFTVRDDFLGRLSVGPEARDALAHVAVIQNLSEQALQEVMRRPVEAVGYTYDEPELVAEMTREVVGETGCLPLLQFVGQMLWDRRDRDEKQLLRSAYEEVGGVEGALATHADGTLDGLSPADLRIARDILVQLVTPERTRRIMSAERILEVLGPRAEPVLARLTDARLVSVTRGRDASIDGPRLELAHESLIRSWRTLGRWLDEGRDELAFIAEATLAAELWHKRGRRPTELWDGDALADASRTLNRLTTELPADVREFLDASQTRQVRHMQWRRRLLIGAGAVLSLVTASAVSVALLVAEKEQEALAQRNEARQQRAAAQSERATTQLEHARGLHEGARAAWAQGDALEARSKLRRSLESRDAAAARAMWWTIGSSPSLWTADLGTFGIAIAYAPDGSMVAAGCQAGAICLFDADTREVRVLGGEREKVIALAFSADGTRLAGGDWKGEVVIWDVRTQTVVGVLAGGHRDRVEAVAFSPDDRLLVSAGRDRRVQLWDLATQQSVALLEGHTGGVRGAEFSPDGSLLVTAGEDPVVRLWNVESHQLVRELHGHTAATEDVVFSPDGTTIASAGVEGVIRIWDVESGSETAVLSGHDGGVRGLAYRPDGRQLASSSYDATIRVWDVETGETERILRGHEASVRDLAFGPDGRHLASTSYDRTARMWDTTLAPVQTSDDAHVGPIRGLAFSPDGTQLVTGGFDGTVRVWNAETGEQSRVFSDTGGSVYGVDFSPDGAYVAAATSGGEARVWDVSTSKRTLTLRGHTASLYAVAFSPDGRSLVTGSRDREVRRWDLETGEVRAAMTGHEQLIWDVAYSLDGRQVAAASWDWTVRVWDAETGVQHSRFSDHEAIVYGVAFSPDGQHLVSTSADQTLRLRDLRNGSSQTLVSGRGRINVPAFHPDGTRVAGPMSDGSTRIWTLDGTEAVVMPGHSKQATVAAFRPDGALVASAGDDGTVRLWNADDGRPYWRAPALLSDPPRLLTHRGWVAMDGGTADVPPTPWKAALENDTLFAEQSPEHDVVCVHGYDDRASAWDLKTGALLDQPPIPNVQRLRAVGGGCVVVDDAGARLVSRGGPPSGVALTEGPVAAIGRGSTSFFVATEGSVAVFDPEGRWMREVEVGRGVAAVGGDDEVLVVGFRNGTMQAVWPDGDTSPLARFEDLPSDRPTRIVVGPMNTVIVGWADGTLGMWSLDDGTRLLGARLHGPIEHLRLEKRTVYAATALGRFTVWDLDVLFADYCELMREVWSRVPTVWQSGRVVAKPAPRDHACQ